VKWLNHTTGDTHLSGNLWHCDCSALGKAWWELKHKLTLNCSSPEHLRGRTRDLPDDFCRPRNTFVKLSGSNNPNLKTPVVNRISATESKFAKEFPESNNQTMTLLRIFHSFRISTKQIRKALHIRNSFAEGDNQTTKTLFINDRNRSPSQMTTILTVTGVLSGCTLTAGGIILAVLV
jgi:hypothetical protein